MISSRNRGAAKRSPPTSRKPSSSTRLLLGMGGSSLCPEVLRLTFGKIKGFPELHVLDSTDPAQIKAIRGKARSQEHDLHRLQQIGQHARAQHLQAIFLRADRKKVGDKEVGNRFIAITDPGSKMQKVAEGDHFRKIFFGVPSIGGRYSALSDFGMVPGAVMGIDIPKFLEDHAGDGEGLRLRRRGRQKSRRRFLARFSAPPPFTAATKSRSSLRPAFRSRRVARTASRRIDRQNRQGHRPGRSRSSGKPAVYGNDRVFAYLRLKTKPNKAQDAAVAALEKAGQPVVRIELPNIYNLGQEFFRWEIATAVAGSIIGINAFNQPDVEASKIETRKLTTEYEEKGRCPPKLRSSKAAASSSTPTKRTPPRSKAARRSPTFSRPI